MPLVQENMKWRGAALPPPRYSKGRAYVVSPEAASLVIEQMKKVARQMRAIASRTDFHTNLRYKAIIVAEDAEEVVLECEEEIG